MLLLVWLDLLLEELDQLLQDVLRLVGHLGGNRGGALVDLHGNRVCQILGDFVQFRVLRGRNRGRRDRFESMVQYPAARARRGFTVPAELSEGSGQLRGRHPTSGTVHVFHGQSSSVNISVITGAGSSPGPHTACRVTSTSFQESSMFLTGRSSGPTRIPFKTNCTLNRISGPSVRLAASLNMVNKSHRRPFRSCPGGIGSGAT